MPTVAISTAAQLGTSTLDPFPTKSPCLSAEQLAISTWSDGSPYSDQAARARTTLVGSDGRFNREAVLVLAQIQLFFGLGAEALESLTLVDSLRSERPDLVAIADILEHQKLTPPNPFSSQEECSDAEVFWTYISSAAEQVSELNTRKLLRAFADLPPLLQSLLLPRFTDQLTKDGHHDTAKAALRLVKRPNPVRNSSVILSEAITQKVTQPDKAIETLNLVTNQATEHTPQALIALTDLLWNEDRTPSPDLPLKLAAFETEYRETVHGPGLRRALPMSHALLGQFDLAFESAEQAMGRDGRELFREIEEKLLTRLVDDGDDLSFLTHIAKFFDQSTPVLRPELSLAISRRLMELGFQDLASAFLPTASATSLSDHPPDVRFLQARIALHQDLPHRVLIALLRLNGQDAERLRAQALQQTGNYAQAAIAFSKVEDHTAASRARWHSGAESNPNADASSQYAQAANLTDAIKEKTNDEQESSQTLSGSHHLLSDSESLRETIGELRLAVGKTPINQN